LALTVMPPVAPAWVVTCAVFSMVAVMACEMSFCA